MTYVAWARPDGGVAVYESDTPELVPDGATWALVDALPDREKRDAWVLQDGAVAIDESRMPVPDKISLRQLLLLAKPDWISEAESLAWAARTALPAIVEQVIVTLPLDQQADARITALTMTEVYRVDQLVNAAATMAMPEATDNERKLVADRLFREAVKR